MRSNIDTFLKTAVLSAAMLFAANNKSFGQTVPSDNDMTSNVNHKPPVRVYSGNQEGVYGGPIKYDRIRNDPNAVIDTVPINKYFGDRLQDVRAIQLGPELKNEKLAVISLKPDTLDQNTQLKRTIIYSFDKDGKPLREIASRSVYIENGRETFSIDCAKATHKYGSDKILIKKEQNQIPFLETIKSTYSSDAYATRIGNHLEELDFESARNQFDQAQAKMSYSHVDPQFKNTNPYTQALYKHSVEDPKIALFMTEHAKATGLQKGTTVASVAQATPQ